MSNQRFTVETLDLQKLPKTPEGQTLSPDHSLHGVHRILCSFVQGRFRLLSSVITREPNKKNVVLGARTS
ncbi:hypothetical protein OPQ81_002884 [Rhizoctonia solani]|nr:hypothetical protein OPQ81_002884 [Rhizoctonia solani]